jgi:large subunit ribosomal protein L24
MGRHVRKGDVVVVNSGKHRGQKGKVVEVLVERDRVRIEGIAVVKRHLKPGRDAKRQEGGIYEKLGSIHLSNVQPVDPSTGRGTRVQFKQLEDGRKVRIAQRSGEQLGEV